MQGVVGLLNGTGNCIGFGRGRAKVKAGQVRDIKKYVVENYQTELLRFEAAFDETKRTVEALLDKEIAAAGDDGEKIFESHLAFLEDPGFVDAIRETIQNESVNAEWAVREVGERIAMILAQVDSELISERSADIRDLYNSMLDYLAGRTADEPEDAGDAKERFVIVMEELVPSFVIGLDQDRVSALVSEKGNITAHAAILAKLKGIPTVVGVCGVCSAVTDGDLIVADSFSGDVHVNPDEQTLDSLTCAMARFDEEQCACAAEKQMDAVTKDGTRIIVEANIGKPDEAALASDVCADGIGLFRSEFLFMERSTLPDEEEQFSAYTQAAKTMCGREVVIRTMDIGGDKPVPSLQLPAEQNPFLGLRAIRVSLQKKDLFLTQLRAILRASVYGDIAILFPMISSMEELTQAKTMVDEAKASLDQSGHAYHADIKIGIMVEIPSVATMSDLFAKEVDFFSIGTNDLIQYTLATDRLNQSIASLYTPYHPAVLRQIAQVAQNGHQAGIETAICGEAASDPLLLPAFIGFGVDRLSMSPNSVPMTKRNVRKYDSKDCEALAQRIVSLPSATAVKESLLAFQQEFC